MKTTKLEATGQILEYTETYKRGDYYKIKFIPVTAITKNQKDDLRPFYSLQYSMLKTISKDLFKNIYN